MAAALRLRRAGTAQYLHSSTVATAARTFTNVNLHAANFLKTRSQGLCSAAPQPSMMRTFIGQYEAALASRPVLTKSITSGVLYGAGDALAQVIAGRNKEPSDSDSAGAEAKGMFDASRWLRAVLFGGVFYPGGLSLWHASKNCLYLFRALLSPHDWRHQRSESPQGVLRLCTSGLAHLHYNFLEHLVVVRWAVRAIQRLLNSQWDLALALGGSGAKSTLIERSPPMSLVHWLGANLASAVCEDVH
eukprot:521073-Pleurochrysis_carterae.AAC.2